MLTCTRMSNTPDPFNSEPLTPCVGTCRLDSLGYCIGCRRTGDEIARWGQMDTADRLYLMRQVLPAREPGSER